MHLKQLKLAGFKSFVDPTVVYFPGQLVAVVGPNGCGKSNIIDAVRWVMGESSAKNLRGESMIDVIFNGASNRKPVGQASVELVFDNHLGRVIGPFASYGEIAVKRIVTRDGDSSYYLNGSKCRRKDITEIFLGTGAGARSYSIIGQGTISRLIEAKPEEIRAFLEEAAGVSKYKERRRETLTRIENTRDNLTRVADIRDELEKQLQRLERQAKSAERYTRLKESEQLCRAEILALKWQCYTEEQRAKQNELQDLAVNFERQQSLLTECMKDRSTLNEKIDDANQQAQLIQESFYQLGTEIVRLEETIQQQNREKKRLEHDRQQLQHDFQAAEEQLKQDKKEYEVNQSNSVEAEKHLKKLKEEFDAKDLRYQQSQKHQVQWEEQWQKVQLATNTLKNELQVIQVNLQHLEQRRQQTLLRLEKLNKEQTSISLTDLQSALEKLEENQVNLKATQLFDEEQLVRGKDNDNQLRLLLQETELQLHQSQDDFHRSNTEFSGLIATQNAARQGAKRHKEGIQEWSSKPRLVDVFKVEPKWQLVCDMILTQDLHAYVLDDFDELWSQLSACERQGESVVTMNKSLRSKASRPRLADKVQSSIPATATNLEYIYTAEHLDEALCLLPELSDYESIVTINGFWLGKGWIKWVNSSEQDEMGLLARQQKITDLEVIVQELQLKIETIRSQRDQVHKQLQENSSCLERYNSNHHSSNEALRVNVSALSAKEQAIQLAMHQTYLIASEISELQLLLEDFRAEQSDYSDKLCHLDSLYQESEMKQQELMQEKTERLAGLATQKTEVDRVRGLLHQAELAYDREKTQLHQLDYRMNREQERLQVLQERLQHLILLCVQSLEPCTALNEQLAEQLIKHGQVELQLTERREELNQLKLKQETLEQLTSSNDLEVKRIQEAIAQAKMQEQALCVRASSVQESLNEYGLQAPTLIESVPQGVTQSMKEDELIAFSEQIKRLGAINLAAIEEFATELQRKQYLDAQHNDLSQALATLETAIEKMDKETHLRLENTFDEVNTSFKSLFPRLFGGGRAQLELTCDNLLEAGIVVMAQPPGKRNSTIHLLSGGEKAMTAVALVFAIFQLNPSPFCMLDEVDAPLDDVNVGRFCDLVKEMSQFVQFLFITHNKVTMELADHLIGVTMREPGVSRLVAVDVKQAVTME